MVAGAGAGVNLTGDPLTPEELRNLEASWLTPEDVEQALIRRVDDATGRELVGRSGSGGEYAGLAFPYILPGEEHIREYRLRRDKPDLEYRNGKPKQRARYLSPPGRGNMLYFPPGTTLEALADTSLPVVITEGEKKALSLSRLATWECEKPRWLPVGIPGVWGWRGTVGKAAGPNGERCDVKGVIPDFDRVGWQGRKVYVCYDSDVQKNDSVKTARTALARMLKSKGADVFYIEVPEGPDGAKQGVGDWLFAAGPELVLAGFKNAKGASVKVPSGFRLSDTGVFSVDPTGENDDTFICSRLEITASTRDADGEEWGRLLEWVDRDGLQHLWAMPMSILSGDGNQLRASLLSGGLEISPNRKARELLATYIQTSKPEGKARCVSRIGWHDGSFVLPDTPIGCGEGEQVLYQSGSGVKHNYRTAGTLEEWQANVGRLCSGNSRLLFGVSCAFAGPLLELMSAESGGFHLRGASSTGKTTVLLLAGSCWGGGGQSGFVQTWRATANGLEAVAEVHNHGLLCLDELGQVDPREAGETAYLLANGRGKSRMSRTIQLRRSPTWNLLFLSSGEISLADHMHVVGRKASAGQEVRLLDIEADAGADMGVFENLHGMATADELARRLTRAAKTYYGTPVRAFLKKLASQQEDVGKAVRNFSDDFLMEHVPAGSSGEISRAAGRFALVGFAGKLATEFGVTGWPVGEAENAAKDCFDSCLDSRGSTGVGDVEAAIRQVRAFVEAHGNSRFQSLAPRHDRGGNEFHERVIDRVGFKSVEGDTEFLILPEAFKQEVCKGLNSRMVAKVLDEHGYLRTDSKGKRSVLHTVQELGRIRVYAVRASILGDEKAEQPCLKVSEVPEVSQSS